MTREDEAAQKLAEYKPRIYWDCRLLISSSTAVEPPCQQRGNAGISAKLVLRPG
jgi:hypothetical protein